MTLQRLFPTLVYRGHLKHNGWQAFNNRLLRESLQLRADDAGGRRWSERNYPAGYTSYNSVNRMHRVSPTFAELERRLRKHVHRLNGHGTITLAGQDIQIPRQGLGRARDIDDPRRRDGGNSFQDSRFTSLAGRIEYQQVHTVTCHGVFLQQFSGISCLKPTISDSVQAGIRFRIGHGCLDHLDAVYLSRTRGKKEGYPSHATVKVHNPFPAGKSGQVAYLFVQCPGSINVHLKEGAGRNGETDGADGFLKRPLGCEKIVLLTENDVAAGTVDILDHDPHLRNLSLKVLAQMMNFVVAPSGRDEHHHGPGAVSGYPYHQVAEQAGTAAGMEDRHPAFPDAGLDGPDNGVDQGVVQRAIADVDHVVGVAPVDADDRRGVTREKDRCHHERNSEFMNLPGNVEGPDIGAEQVDEIVKVYTEKYFPLCQKHNVKIIWEPWAGGPNIATGPVGYEALFKGFNDSPYVGLLYDPSHLQWQFMDPVQAARDFIDKIWDVHLKDTEILWHVLRKTGINPLNNARWWRFRLPGSGIVDWKGFFTVLQEAGYQGAMNIEHEDEFYYPAYANGEFTEQYKAGFRLAHKFLRQYVPE